MLISQINENNTNFQALHVTKQALKAMGTSRRALLQNPSISEAANKYEVLAKPSKKPRKMNHRSDILSYIQYGGGALAISSFVVSGGGAAFLHGIGPVLALIAGMFIGAIGCSMLFAPYVFYEWAGDHNGILIQAGEKFENDKLSGIKTKQYEINDNKAHLPSLVTEMHKRIMETKIGSVDSDNLFTAENYLAMLKCHTPDKNTLNKKINDQGDTLLTQFFDVVPDESGIAYKQIINILRNIKGIDYNQKGALGVSCLEKIMNSENAEALELVKDFEFNYTPELDYAFNSIQNQKLKKQILKLNIKFNEILNAIKLKSDEALKKLEPQLDSPLCNRKKLAKDIEKTLKGMKNPVYENWFKATYLKYMNTGESNLID